jgi:hypothetical protein
MEGITKHGRLLRFNVFLRPADTFNFLHPSFIPANLMTLFIGMLSEFLFFPKTLFEIVGMFTELYG